MSGITGFVTYGTTITDILNSWADFGIFAYVLPFLMIFAIVFGILSKSNLLGENRGVQAVIALVVGLISLQFDYVTNFFSLIFPYAGVGLSILLIALIFIGLVGGAPSETWVKVTLGIIAIIIFFVVVFNSLSDFTWLTSGYLGDIWQPILAGVLLLGLIAFIIFGKKKEDK